MKDSPPENPGSLLYPLGLTLLVPVLVGLGCWMLYRGEAGRIDDRMRERETVRTGMMAHFLRADLQPAANDLRLLATGDGLQDYLLAGQGVDRDRATHRAVFISRLHPEYDQLRYLDENGREILRVNRGGQVVPLDKLQDKSDRPYFQKVRNLGPGRIYVSAFDLNVENGRVEVPFVATLRFATPVFDSAGRPHGVYVINILGDDLISHLGETATVVAHRLRLLNAGGFWLKAADPAQEWGFMFPERAGFTLTRTDPELWSRLARDPAGQESHAGGLLTWQRIYPADFITGSAGGPVADEPYLIVASEVSAPEYAALFAGLRRIFVAVAIALAGLAAASVWFLHARRRAREELRCSEENLAVTLQSIGDGVLATDTAGRITLMNPVAEALTGWTLAAATGRAIAEVFCIINEETRQSAVIPVDRVLATGEIHGLANHTLLLARDGRERAIADSAAPIRDHRGRIRGVVLVFRDVSRERAAELKLSAARNELDRFFTLSLDFLCIASADGYFKRVSAAVTDVLGWSVAEFLAMPYLEQVHPDDRAATEAEVDRQVLAGEKVLHFENRYRHKDGSWRVLSWRSVPFGTQMYATARDVTEPRRFEDQIQALNAELTRHAAGLESANKELEAFSYSVSHDLRAPLRHIQGYATMLDRETQGRLSEKARHQLSVISESARNMGQLIDDLLSFSRMGRAEMREAPVDLAPVVAEVRAELEPTAAGRTIQWTISALPRARGDAVMLKQVFANLLGNAVKYTRRREAAQIEVGCAGEEDGRLIFFVRDNGAGFDMEYAGKLFGVFQRLHRADEFEGTGIGLANVRRIIARHGGRTWAEGKVDAGATFYFTLAPAGAG